MPQRGMTSVALRDLQPAAHLASDTSAPACDAGVTRVPRRMEARAHPGRVCGPRPCLPSLYLPRFTEEGAHTPWGPVLGAAPSVATGEKQAGHRRPQDRDRDKTWCSEAPQHRWLRASHPPEPGSCCSPDAGEEAFPWPPGHPDHTLSCPAAEQLLSPARPVPTLRDPRAALSSRHQCPHQGTHTRSEASPRQEGNPGRGPGGHRCNTQIVRPPCVEFSQPLQAAGGLWVSGGAGHRGSGDA